MSPSGKPELSGLHLEADSGKGVSAVNQAR